MDSIATQSPKERGQLFESAEVKHSPKIIAPIIEKDFWVCWTLYRLFDVMHFQPQLIFKGGTSLSKAFNAIERFSEDVDLSLSRHDLDFTGNRDPEQPGISNTEKRRRLERLTVHCQKQYVSSFCQRFALILPLFWGNQGGVWNWTTLIRKQ